jgi:hypothetical protein
LLGGIYKFSRICPSEWAWFSRWTTWTEKNIIISRGHTRGHHTLSFYAF